MLFIYHPEGALNKVVALIVWKKAAFTWQVLLEEDPGAADPITLKQLHVPSGLGTLGDFLVGHGWSGEHLGELNKDGLHTYVHWAKRDWFGNLVLCGFLPSPFNTVIFFVVQSNQAASRTVVWTTRGRLLVKTETKAILSVKSLNQNLFFFFCWQLVLWIPHSWHLLTQAS